MEPEKYAIISGYDIYTELKNQYAKVNEISEVLSEIKESHGSYSNSYKIMNDAFQTESKKLEEMKKAEYNF